MTNQDAMRADKYSDALEWSYCPPPTVYDLLRDGLPMKSARWLLHSIAHPLLRRYNKLRVIDRDNVLNNWPCVITPNHSSHMDTVAVFASLPLAYVNRTFALAAKDYFFRNSAIALGARLAANIIPIDRTGEEKTGLQICLTKQREGGSILIFPEGTRSSTGETGQFKKGAVMLSREAKTPIIPTYIRGTLESMPKATNFPRPFQITVVYGAPLRYWEAPLNNLEDEQAAHHLEQCVKAMKQDWKRL